MPEIIISRKSDLDKIAQCHASAFPESLSSKMGRKYLRKMIEWYLADEKRFLFHAEEDGKCAGYFGGMIHDGTQSTGSASGMIQFSFNEAVISILSRPWLLFHKEVTSKYSLISKNIKNRFSTRKTETKKNKNSGSKATEPSFGLVVIGVAQEYRGKGYGSFLLREFESEARKRNIFVLELTVRNDNEEAIRAYERNGWIRSKLSGSSLEMFKKLDIKT
jgi:ribosomal protein S18 acetylase RimI-like enzyme